MMPFEPCHIEYDLSRRQRLCAHFGVWKPYLAGLLLIVGGGATAVVLLSALVSPWFSVLILVPLWFARGFVVGLLDVIFVVVKHMDIVIEENGLGFATARDRLWIFLDGVIRVQQYATDTWTIVHFNGTVISIPTAAIDEQYIAHIRNTAERGQTREGVQAVVARGERNLEIEAESRRMKTRS